MGARARIITAALCAAFATTQAAGQTTAYAPGDGTPNSLQLNIPVTASVGVACGFSTAPSGTHNEPDFDTHAWSHDFPFTLDCSIASRVAVVSTNGALLTGGAAPAGYTTSAPYDVALHVVQNTGSADATCAVANLQTGGSCSFRGPASAGLGGAGLNVAVSQNQPGSYLRVSAPAYTGTDVLVASPGYADTLVVTLSPAA